MEGESDNSGRVEIRHKGVWGTVCDDNFGEAEAAVFCRMLGHDTVDAVVYNGTADLSGDAGPVWIRFADNEGCTGREDSIAGCKSASLWEHDHHCSHLEDVAITCGDRNKNDYQAEDFIRDDDDDLSYTPSEELSEGCGIVSVTSSDTDTIPRISGGTASKAGSHPWQATVRVRGREKSYHWCGAVVVSRRHLLTAAHCLREFPLSTYLIRVGDFALGKLNLEKRTTIVCPLHA